MPMRVALRAAAVLLCAAIGALVGARQVLFVVTVRGDSMEPSLQDGDRLLVARRPARLNPHRGWIVVGPLGRVLRATGSHDLDRQQIDQDTLFIKRIVAGPGDLRPVRAAGEFNSGPLRSGEWFVWGDNPTSADSTHWGPIATDTIAGVVLFRLRAAHNVARPSVPWSPRPLG